MHATHTHRLRASIALGRFRAPLALLAGVVIAAPSPGQPPPGTRLDFEPAQGYATGDCCPWGLATGDIDNDGDIDLVVANEVAGICINFAPSCAGLGSITVFMNTGDWSTPGSGLIAQTPIQIDEPNNCVAGTPAHPREVALACIDGDNRLDLIVTTTSGHVMVFTNNGGGAFTCTAGYLLPCPGCAQQTLGLNGLVVADLDDDGFNDLGVASMDGGSSATAVWRMFNDGAGAFPALNIDFIRRDIGTTAVFGPPFDIVAGRFDNTVASPGWDLVTSNSEAGSVTMIKSRLGRTSAIENFDAPPLLGYHSMGIVRKRLDAGTTPDVGLTGQAGIDMGFSLIGDGAGTLTFRDEVAPGDAQRIPGVASARLDGNTSRELVFVLWDLDQIAIAQNAGDGTFPTTPKFFSIVPTNELNAEEPKQVVIADFNDDGFKDIAVTAIDPVNQNSGRLSVLLHKPPIIGD